MSEGKRIGGYVLECPIGSGGMGEVWLAQHEVLARPTVLKKLRRELAGSDEILERFEREARTAASLHERQVVAVYDAFRFRNELYIAQEYVEGADLRSILDRIEVLPAPLATFIALEIARGLEAIHNAGTIHRDLKPGNLLISREGDVKIADFGIALERTGPDLTQLGVVVGTPAYMAPEQLLGERADARTDLFSLGAVFYEMLTGRPPYPDSPSSAAQASPGAEAPDASNVPAETNAPSPVSRLTLMRKERYPSPRRLRKDVPRRIARTVRGCLRTKPTRRPTSAAALRAQLESLGTHPDAVAARAELAAFLWERGVFVRREAETVVRLAPMLPEARRRPRRLRLVAASAACVAIALLTVGVITVAPAAGWSDSPSLWRDCLDWLRGLLSSIRSLG